VRTENINLLKEFVFGMTKDEEIKNVPGI